MRDPSSDPSGFTVTVRSPSGFPFDVNVTDVAGAKTPEASAAAAYAASYWAWSISPSPSATAGAAITTVRHSNGVTSRPTRPEPRIGITILTPPLLLSLAVRRDA